MKWETPPSFIIHHSAFIVQYRLPFQRVPPRRSVDQSAASEIVWKSSAESG